MSSFEPAYIKGALLLTTPNNESRKGSSATLQAHENRRLSLAEKSQRLELIYNQEVRGPMVDSAYTGLTQAHQTGLLFRVIE